MNIINRMAISIKPKQPYLDWANFVATSYESLDEIQRTSKVILLPTTFDNSDLFLEANHQQLFKLELRAWIDDPTVWPKQRDLAMFKQWFDVEFYALVLDSSMDEFFTEPYA